MKDIIQQYLEKHGFGQFCPKAVLFDMDGVIYDSMKNHAVSWHESMGHYGLDMPYEAAYECEGMRGVETIRQLVQRQRGIDISEAEAKEMYDYKARLFAENQTAHPAPLMSGIKELMQQMKADGLQICIVTGSAQHTLLDKLQTDLEGLVVADRIVTAFDVTHGKPNPEPYLCGMAKCGVEPWQTIVVENAPLGVRAAVAARCFTIAVNTGPLPDEKLRAEGAHLIYPRMTALAEDYHCLYPSLYRV